MKEQYSVVKVTVLTIFRREFFRMHTVKLGEPTGLFSFDHWMYSFVFV